MKLTEKQKRFIEEYVIDLNATKAAERSGYSKRTARNIGCENLTKPNILKKIHEKLKENTDDPEKRLNEMMNTLKVISFAIITDYLEMKDGEISIGNLKNINRNKLAAIQQIQITDTKYGKNQKLKLYDKLKSIEILGKYIDIEKLISDKEEPITLVREIISNRDGFKN